MGLSLIDTRCASLDDYRAVGGLRGLEAAVALPPDAGAAGTARRHLAEDDDRMDRRAKASKPRRPTTGDEVLRKVDPSGSVSFAGTSYRVGNRFIGHVLGVRLVADTVQITQEGTLVRTHRARHDKTKEFGALANPGGRPRRSAQDVAWVPEPLRDTGTETSHPASCFGLELTDIVYGRN